jgi:hypothetical protein
MMYQLFQGNPNIISSFKVSDFLSKYPVIELVTKEQK